MPTRQDHLNAGLSCAVKSCAFYETMMGQEASVDRALGFLQGVAAYLVTKIGHREAYALIQRQADSVAECILTPGETGK